jgi:hypothetical protein
MSGRIATSTFGCYWGAPSGLTTAPSCDPATVSGLVPYTARITSLFAQIDTALTADALIRIRANAPSQAFIDELTCTIPAGLKTCTAPGPSGTVPAGSSLAVISSLPGAPANPQPAASFGYTLTPVP